MTLPLLLLVPLLGGLAALLLGRLGPRAARIAALAALALELLLAALLGGRGAVAGAGGPARLAEFRAAWIPSLGVSVHLGLDGLSLVMVLIAAGAGIAAVLCSWREIGDRVGLFHFNLLWCLAGAVGVFLSLDLFLFTFSWELMLLPMFLLVVIWGHEDRRRAAIRFFVFTQLGGMLLLGAVTALALLHARAAGSWTFETAELARSAAGSAAAPWIFAALLAAFAVKLPAIPLHGWLPAAHTQAPTGGSVLLAALLLKTGAYGMLRVAVPLFPAEAAAARPALLALGVGGILYGAVLSFGQRDLKRLIAYTSVSHMGFVLLGVAAWNEASLQGAIVVMVCHALATGGLFVLAGIVQERLGTREIASLGGLWQRAPRLGSAGLLLALAALGLPGMGTFVGEFLVLLGVFAVSPFAAAAAAAGLVLSTVYALAMVQRVFFGPAPARAVGDLAPREASLLAAMLLLLIAIGLHPAPLLEATRTDVRDLVRGAPAAGVASAAAEGGDRAPR